jgi:hypothetical protein
MFKGENIMHFIKTSLRCVQVALLTGAALTSSWASAASQCAGTQQDACASMAQCTWVNGYVRKDGRSVASHCKTKARKKSADQASSGAVKMSRAK